MRTGIVEGGTFCTSVPVLAAAGGDTVVDTTNAIDFCLRGRSYTCAALTSCATPVADINTGEAFVTLGTDEACIFILCMDSTAIEAGLKVAQGPIVAVDPDTDARLADPPYPVIPDGVCPFGFIIMQSTGALSGGWLFGTSNWNKAGTTMLVGDLMVMPDRLINQATA
jgi:hypothetical protein